MSKTSRKAVGLLGGAWLSLVERLLWEQDVGGSNPLAPTTAGTALVKLERIGKHVDGAGTHFQAGEDRDAIRGADPKMGARVRTGDPPPARSADGMVSAEDTLNEVQLHFETLEEAVAFATKHGLDYTVIAPHESTEKPKSYADNFRYDRVRN